MATYHAFHYGKMNQSFKFENEENVSLYEANLVKFKLFSPSDYEFVNHIAATTTPHKIGKKKSVNQGLMGANMTTSSYFKIDGKNCFEILEEMGYTFRLLVKLDILHPEFALVDKNGNQVAVYKMNVRGDREENVLAIGNSQRNTVITTESEDLDAIFLAAYIMSNVDFSLNVM